MDTELEQLRRTLDAIRHRAQCTDTGMGADILKILADAPVGSSNKALTPEEQAALKWALEQQFQSVSARYARTLAKLVQHLYPQP
jgi:hypothetical protein